MTQDELSAALASGKVSIESPESSESEAGGGASLPATPTLSLAQFLPLLLQLQSVQQCVATAPTYIPQTFQDQIQFVFDGTKYWLYLYFNNQWNSIQLGGSVVSQIIAGSGITISPGGGTGTVTITNANPTPAYSEVSSGGFYLYQDTASASIANSTPTKVHELQFPSGMPTSTFTVLTSITGGATGSPNQQYNVQIYKNGVAYGAMHTATPNTTNYSSSPTIFHSPQETSVRCTSGGLARISLPARTTTSACSAFRFPPTLSPRSSARHAHSNPYTYINTHDPKRSGNCTLR